MSKKYVTRIFLVDDDPIITRFIKISLEQNDLYDIHVFANGREFLNNIHLAPDIVIIDYNLPDMSGLEILQRIKETNSDIRTILLSGQEKLEVVVEAYNKGVNNYIIKNENVVFELNNSLRNLIDSTNLRKEVLELREQIIDRNRYNTILGDSRPVLQVLKLIQKVENTNLITLITGESGTGKEVVAASIHYNSPRSRRPFVPVNMAAIPVDLIESELFGHEKGAFTGASYKRIGKFEEANDGTIFLDEIGEMPLDLQAKLLRVLQDSKITRVGSNKEIKLDIRVIAATNKDLGQRVREGKFREDLMYRLQGFLIHLPPLRDRGNDVIILAKNFLTIFCKSNKMSLKTISNSAADRLLKHSWPGNVRELKSVIERAALLSDNDQIDADDILFTESGSNAA
ncbi:MAG TPA: sigma-54 dependent transcriptional regulator [Ohtaekwangia sp.]|uniref:sigma-54-dependent transcriptional regulator n=1 Tax=Ohtaekwangia sp. TaxID=2066019 RepID=UPI002F9239DE